MSKLHCRQAVHPVTFCFLILLNPLCKHLIQFANNVNGTTDDSLTLPWDQDGLIPHLHSIND